jgi:hypothetical protein
MTQDWVNLNEWLLCVPVVNFWYKGKTQAMPIYLPQRAWAQVTGSRHECCGAYEGFECDTHGLRWPGWGNEGFAYLNSIWEGWEW